MLFALLAVVGTILYIGFQNSANAAPQQVEFNAVTINNGAKFAVVGDKTWSAVDNGRYIVADYTNGQLVNSNQYSSAENSFESSFWQNDALFRNATTGVGSALSTANVRSYSSFIDSVDFPYWCSGTATSTYFIFRDYANADNTLNVDNLRVTGKVGSTEYIDSRLASGPLAFYSDVTPESFTTSEGGIWDSSVSSVVASGHAYREHFTEDSYIKDGVKIYNNPGCKESGTDSNNLEYKSSTVQNLDASTSNKVLGYVADNGRIKELQLGQTLPAGTVLVYTFDKRLKEITDTTGFMGSNLTTGYNYIVGFIKTESPVKIVASGSNFFYIYGISRYFNEGDTVQGVPIVGASKAIRLKYSTNLSMIAFFRTSSNSSVVTSDTFGNLPLSSVFNGGIVKVVSKSRRTTISDGITNDKLSTDLDSVKETTYSDSTIKVPYGSKTLTINKSAFTTANANYVSALADANDMKKYTVLGSTEEDITIDLASIVNTHQSGDCTTISFYAEMVNGAGYTDEISEAPVTLNIEVNRGGPQTITYNAGGGSGTVPESATALSGSSYAMALGSSLTKNGNPFTSWTLSYTPFGDTSPITRFVGGGEPIVVPDTANGNITATANYSGIAAGKTTDSSSTVVTVTWDTNAPEGETAKFAEDMSGDFNSSRTKKFNKINGITLSAPVPGAPTDLSSTMNQIFDGWYTDPVGGTKVTGSVTPTVSTTYYAHWIARYNVTYDATGGTGATITGKFSDGTTNDEETVMPNASTVGPSKAYPVPDDTSGDYIFYGWFNQPNGAGGEFKTGTSFDEIGGSKTVYAYYGLAYTFLAPATSTVTANPRVISGYKYSISEVKDAAQSIRATGVNPNETVYNATNDSYHLYTLLKGSDGKYLDADLTDSWAEFRIIGIGNHDEDGAAITFQMVHGMPSDTGWAYDSTGATGINLNWRKSTLRGLMQDGGSIYNMFDKRLTNRIAPIRKKYNAIAGNADGDSDIAYDEFTILSYTEYQKSVNTDYWTTGQVGSTYAFWNQYSISNDSSQYIVPLRKLCKSRNGMINMGTTEGHSWLRSVSPKDPEQVLYTNYLGYLGSNRGAYQSRLFGVALSFSL